MPMVVHCSRQTY